MFKRQFKWKSAKQNKSEEKITLSLKNKLIIGVIMVSMILSFGTMSSNYRHTYQNVRNDVIELSKSSSAKNAESIEMFFTRHADILLATAEMLEHSLSDPDVDNEEIKDVLYRLSEEYNERLYKRATDKDFTGIYASVNGELIHAYKSTTLTFRRDMILLKDCGTRRALRAAAI